MKGHITFFIGFLVVAGIMAVAIHLWIINSIKDSNSNDYATIGEIPIPDGFERVDCENQGTVL